MMDQSIKESISTPSHSALTMVLMSLSPNLVAEWNSTPSGRKGPYMRRNRVTFKNTAESRALGLRRPAGPTPVSRHPEGFQDCGPRHTCRAPTCSPCGWGHLCFLRQTRSKLESTYKLKQLNKSATKGIGSPAVLASRIAQSLAIPLSNRVFKQVLFKTFQRHVTRENKVLRARSE